MQTKPKDEILAPFPLGSFDVRDSAGKLFVWGRA
jgi:hypothetical protein